MRYTHDGFFDKFATHGEITCYGQTDEHAQMAAFRARLVALSRVGTWQKRTTKWKQVDDGTQLDPTYFIVDWGQDV